MPGDVLIKFFVYLIRSAGRSFRLRETIGWKSVPATIHHGKVTGGEVETVYTYQFEGGYYSGLENRDFFWHNSAEGFAARFPNGRPVVIRVNPNNPEQMAFRDDDQGV